MPYFGLGVYLSEDWDEVLNAVEHAVEHVSYPIGKAIFITPLLSSTDFLF